ncbi:MAG: protein kinase [Planctomycetes bacterium]|nr:protein kinase [Planctomycetota bacterium]
MTDPRDRLKRLLAAGLEGDTASLPAPGAWRAPPPAELAGVFPRLEPLELLGQGGMGAVYKARQTHLDRLVALKVLSPQLAADPGFADRFTREALALARLSHPHIVALHDVGEAGGWRYLVMEYVPGATLRQALRTGTFSAREALALVPQLCDALDYAHAQGVVHRDLKPENILLDARGLARIADFGLAKVGGGASDAGITRTGQILGTAAYMAPEQMAGSPAIDHRADLYALGVLIYEMLTGELPVGRFALPSQRAQVDVRVDEVVLRALERTPELRWQSADAVRRAVDGLAPAAAGRGPGWRVAALLCLLAAGAGALAAWWFTRPALPVAAPVQTSTAALTPPLELPSLPFAIDRVEVQVCPSPATTAVPAVVALPAAAVPATTAVPVVVVAAPAPQATVAAVAEAVTEPPAAPATVAASRTRLALEGGGSLELEERADALPLDQLPARGVDGASVSVGADGGLRLRPPAGRSVRLAVQPGAIAAVDAAGSGELHLRGLTGPALLIRQLGSGRVQADGLRVGRLELRQQGTGETVLAGRAELLVLDQDQGAGLDATRLQTDAIEAVVRGSGSTRLAGRVARLRLRLSGTGRVEAGGLDVEAADVTLTGSGSAQLGTLGALDATCTGSGSLRYQGTPRLGRIITRDHR